MAVKNSLLGGTDWLSSDGLTATDLNGTFDEVIERLDIYNNNISIIAEQSTYTATNDITHWLSKDVCVVLDASAGIIYKSLDGGDTFTSKDSGYTKASFPNLIVNSNDYNYMIAFDKTYNGQVKYSDDAGDTWTSVTAPTDADTNAISYSITDSGRIYSIYRDGTNWEIAYTDNAGTSWTVVTDPSITDSSDFSASNDSIGIDSPTNGIICYGVADYTEYGNQGRVGYSTDNGSTWTEASVDTQRAICNNCFYVDSENYIFLLGYVPGSNTNVLYQINTGKFNNESITIPTNNNHWHGHILEFTSDMYSFFYEEFETFAEKKYISKVYIDKTINFYFSAYNTPNFGLYNSVPKYQGLGINDMPRLQFGYFYSNNYPARYSEKLYSLHIKDY